MDSNIQRKKKIFSKKDDYVSNINKYGYDKFSFNTDRDTKISNDGFYGNIDENKSVKSTTNNNNNEIPNDLKDLEDNS